MSNLFDEVKGGKAERQAKNGTKYCDKRNEILRFQRYEGVCCAVDDKANRKQDGQANSQVAGVLTHMPECATQKDAGAGKQHRNGDSAKQSR